MLICIQIKKTKIHSLKFYLYVAIYIRIKPVENTKTLTNPPISYIGRYRNCFTNQIMLLVKFSSRF